LQQIERLSPGNAYVLRHISQNEGAVEAGKDRSFDVIPMISIGAVVVLVLAGAGVTILIVALRRKPAPAGATPQGYPVAEPAPGAPTAFAPPAASDAAVMAEPVGDVVTLLVIAPSGTRQMVVGLPAIVGQAADCQIVVDDPEASDRHAAIVRVNGVLEVTDLGGCGGIRVNDTVVAVAPLQQGDRIKIGQTEVVVA
jgi:hypothetical protein